MILFFCFCYLLFLFRFCSFRGALLPIWSLVVIGSLEQFEKVEAYISFSFFVVNDKVPGVSSNNKPLSTERVVLWKSFMFNFLSLRF